MEHSATTTRGLVVVAEDDRSIADLIPLYLRRDGYGVHVEGSGDGALAAVRRLAPIAAIIDITLPGVDGIEVCRALRAENNWVPVLFVTARDGEVDRVVGLELGADDYITKPFSPRELVARVRSVLRRSVGDVRTEESLAVGAVRIDPRSRRTWIGPHEVRLTTTEFELLAHLMRSPGRVFTREQLLSSVWGYGADAGTRTVDVHVAQVRAKLGEQSPNDRSAGKRASGPAPRRDGPLTACQVRRT